MSRKKPAFKAITPVVIFLVLIGAGIAPAQIDPDPNSPAPILLHADNDGTRVLSTRSSEIVKNGTPGATEAYSLGDLVKVYVKGIELMAGEGAGAPRHADTARGPIYARQGPLPCRRPFAG